MERRSGAALGGAQKVLVSYIGASGQNLLRTQQVVAADAAKILTSPNVATYELVDNGGSLTIRRSSSVPAATV